MVVERIEVEAVFKDLASRDASKMAKVFTDEVERALDAAESTAVEFGATADQLPKIFKAIDKAAKETGRTFAEAAKAFEKLVDESEDTEFALNNVSSALTQAQLNGTKVEDEARKIGEQFKTSTSQTSPFAAALAKVDLELGKAGLGFVSARQLLGGLALAAGTATAALAAFVNTGLKQAIENSVKTRVAVEDLTGAYENLAESVVAAYTEHETFQKSTNKAAKEMNALAAIMDEAGVSVVDLQLGTAKLLTVMNPLVILMAPLILATAGVKEGFHFLAVESEFAYQGVDRVNGIMAQTPAAARAAADALANPLVAQLTAVGREADAAGQAIQGMLDIAAQGQVAGVLTAANRAGVVGTNLARVGEAAATAARQGRSARRSGGGGGGRSPQRSVFDFEATQRDVDARNRMLGGLGADDLSGVLSGGRGAAAVSGTPLTTEAEFPGLDALKEQNAEVEANAKSYERWHTASVDLRGGLQDLANGGIMAVTGALGSMVEAAAAGELSLSKLGTGLLTSMGDMLVQFGQGLMLAALGVQALETGILSPGAAIAIAAGAIAAGAAMKGFARRGQNQPTGGGSAAAIGSAERRFDRLQNRPEDREARVVYLNVDGRQMQSYLTDTANDGIRRGRISTTPRRAT